MRKFNNNSDFKKIKSIVTDKLFLIVVFMLAVIICYIEYRDYRENLAYEEAFDTIYGLQNEKENKPLDKSIVEAPFVIRSEAIQSKYDECVKGDAYRCNELADYEKSQGHLVNYLNFLQNACVFSPSYCYFYAGEILKYYTDKELAKSEAMKYYTISCDNGDTQSCSKILKLKGYK